MTPTETICAVVSVWIAILIVAVLVIRFFQLRPMNLMMMKGHCDG